ncbi:MAG: CRISPR-associated helicase Cas3' [Clostridiales bacterium]|nr:CRISPR-associated helicase Cas3' [Clostridiales bacterium]
MFYAHIREDGQKQSVEEHLRGTAARCAAFAAKFGEEKRGAMLGTAHDIGKCSDAFQKRLFGGPKVDHATAGALECAKIGDFFSACCVAGHHGGLPDFGNPRTDGAGAPTFAGRINRSRSGGIPAYRWDTALPDPGPPPELSDMFSQSLWTRMLYSCLVDADYLDTEAFMSEQSTARGGYDPLPVLAEKLDTYIAPWFPAKNDLNRKRCRILQECMDAAALPRGIYTLTVPTGGGKTVASLAFALRHAVANGLDRVIYVIPYTSIIEQNAAVFRSILGENNVVEHHSGICRDDADETGKDNLFQRLAAENWDAPVIVTTAVQFFESLYSNRPSQCRKLHNIANSVVIFDEAQMLPVCHLQPCVGAIANLTAHFRSSMVLCTATQPVLSDLIHAFCPSLSVRELCSHGSATFREFRRVTYRSGGKLSDEALASELCRHEQVLCIVNTRKAARSIFGLLPPEGRFHLSTLMVPEHRKAVLDTIRRRLQDGLPCRVISTSLIEAGVDVDFPSVYRELAGLDSIAQAAGRCNREGKNAARDSVVTYYEGETPAPLLQRVNIRAAQEALQGNRDPGDPETMERYFTALRSLTGSRTDKSHTVEHLRNGFQGCILPFETVARDFHLIDEGTCTVYIPLGGGVGACAPLIDGTAGREDYRRAGLYGVNVYTQHFRALTDAGDVLQLTENSAVLSNLSLYDPETGLSLSAESGKADFI